MLGFAINVPLWDDSFTEKMKQVHFNSLKKCVLMASGKTQLDVKTEIYIRSYCQGTVDLTFDWIMDMYDLPPEELAEIYENCLPYPLRRYLIKEESS